MLIASAGPGDGKTTIARHLAAAAMRSRVLLVEADLRHPTRAAIFGLPSGPGLSDVLIGALPLSEATLPIELQAPSGGEQLARPPRRVEG